MDAAGWMDVTGLEKIYVLHLGTHLCSAARSTDARQPLPQPRTGLSILRLLGPLPKGLAP